MYTYILALSDQRGHVYIFDFLKNKFWILARTGVSATALQFNSVRRRELIVCLSDCTIHCYNIDTCMLIAKLPIYHHSSPRNISIHSTKPLVLTTSDTESILWDTESWERLRVLTSKEGVQQASFSNDGQSIVAAFKDGSIYFWTISSFSLLWKISLDKLFTSITEMSAKNTYSFQATRTNYFSISQSGEYFAYSGLSLLLITDLRHYTSGICLKNDYCMKY
jgi:WD40 repeat protein